MVQFHVPGRLALRKHQTAPVSRLEHKLMDASQQYEQQTQLQLREAPSAGEAREMCHPHAISFYMLCISTYA